MSEPTLPTADPVTDSQIADFYRLKKECKKRWGRASIFRFFILLRANRWAHFETEELDEVIDRLERHAFAPVFVQKMVDQIESELARRRAGGAA
jgi:hypothetical protein